MRLLPPRIGVDSSRRIVAGTAYGVGTAAPNRRRYFVPRAFIVHRWNQFFGRGRHVNERVNSSRPGNKITKVALPRCLFMPPSGVIRTAGNYAAMCQKSAQTAAKDG